MGNNENTFHEDEDMFVTLTMEDNSEVECQVLTIFEVEEQDYIVLLPLNQDGSENDEEEVFIYRYFEDEEGNPSLENILDDEEFEMVEEVFDQILDDEEFEEM
jgi:uncharacterized protein YrzB (UPF0473 family)